MTTHSLLTPVTGRTYQVIVTTHPDDPGRDYQYTISRYGTVKTMSDENYARAVADGYTYPQTADGWVPRAVLHTPPVTDQQAEAMALAWLTAVETVDPGALDCVLILPGIVKRIGV